MHKLYRYLLWSLCGLFVFTYPFGVIGIAFDVRPPFSMEWAGTFMLFLQGTIVILAVMWPYGWRRALFAGGSVIVLTYLVETLGVQTGFPFGVYRYTPVLLPALPGSVPLAVMFAWVLVVLGGYSIVKHWGAEKRGIHVGAALWGALLAVLLDLAIEPVAAHVVDYWEWKVPGSLAYYGVPVANFVAWYVVACGLLLLVDVVLSSNWQRRAPQGEQIGWMARQKMGGTERLAVLAPRLLFCASLFMFGLIDLTHGYYLGTLSAGLAGLVIIWRSGIVHLPLWRQRLSILKR